jgi:hypothetical protein
MDVGQAMLLSTKGESMWTLLFSIEDNMSSKIIGAPVETGVTVFDNKVIMPREVSLRGIITLGHNGFENDVSGWTPERCLEDLKKAFADRSYSTYSVVTKTETINNLIVESLQYSHTSEKFDAVDVSISLKELLVAKQSYRQVERVEKPRNIDNRDTISSGMKGIQKTVNDVTSASDALLLTPSMVM